MRYNSEIHQRRSIRLKGYDYSQPGAYFVTNVAQKRKCLFGVIIDGKMRLNEAGRIVRWTWHDLPNHVANIELDEFIVMPNHMHGIIIIRENDFVGAGSEPTPTKSKPHSLPEIIRQFKTFSAKRINQWRGTVGVSVWQRKYYEHIIRDENELNRIRQYIRNNPANWQNDKNNVLL